MNQDIRWKQRFQNFEKAYLFLERACKQQAFNELEAAGLIQSFEFTFELAWKTLKDYLESMGLPVSYPRDVLKTAFQNGLVKNGKLWLEMLEKRNELTHTYDEAHKQAAIQIIQARFFLEIKQVYNALLALT